MWPSIRAHPDLRIPSTTDSAGQSPDPHGYTRKPLLEPDKYRTSICPVPGLENDLLDALPVRLLHPDRTPLDVSILDTPRLADATCYS